MPSRQLSPTVSELRGVQLGSAVFILSLATFIVILDATIINVAVPHIAGSFAASPSEGTWVITSYAVAEALTVPLSGWLANRFGTVRVLITAISSFALFSALCGVAPSLQMLVMFRVFQGLSGGPLIPISQTLIMRVVPPAKLEAMMGLWMMTSILAPIAGPILGGVLADTVGWRWAFYLNVPVAAVCGAVGYLIFRNSETPCHKQNIDYVGLALLILWVGAFQTMLDTGEDLDWFSSTRIVMLLMITVIGLVLFVIWEVTDNAPVVDLRVFRFRGFIAASVAMFLAFGAFFASLVLLPLWLQIGMNYTATHAGYVLALQAAFGVIVAPLAAGLMSRVEPRLLMSAGLVILAISVFCRSSFSTAIGFDQMIWPQLIMGIGLPLFFVPLMTVSLKAVPPIDAASASGIINFIRTIAGAIAAAIVVALWNHKTVITHAQLAPFLDPSRVLMPDLAVTKLTHGQIMQSTDGAVWQQSMMISANQVSAILGFILALAAIAIWAFPRKQQLYQ